MLFLESTFPFHYSLFIDNFSNGLILDYFPLSQFNDDQILRRGLPINKDYIGDDIYTDIDDHGNAVYPIDYGDSSYGGTNELNEEGYTENGNPYLFGFRAKMMSPEKNEYSLSYGTDRRSLFDPQNENLGEEISIEDCDKEIQLSDGTWFYFVYKDLNATRCMCHYSNYKDPELMPGYDCSIVSSRGKRNLLTLPDQDYKNAYSCKASIDVKAAHSTQVFLYKKLKWENWHFRRTCYCIYEKKIDPTITFKRRCDNCKHWRGLPRPTSGKFRHYKWCPMEP